MWKSFRDFLDRYLYDYFYNEPSFTMVEYGQEHSLVDIIHFLNYRMENLEKENEALTTEVDILYNKLRALEEIEDELRKGT
tara:strand:+ start:2498 stop:2740 length:243 start_codon:yes stop_codon:yes gene_type:complete